MCGSGRRDISGDIASAMWAGGLYRTCAVAPVEVWQSLWNHSSFRGEWGAREVDWGSHDTPQSVNRESRDTPRSVGALADLQ